MTPILAFDIETVPDTRAVRLLNGLPGHLNDTETAEYALQQCRARTGKDFLPLHLHRIVAVACCLRWNGKIHIAAIGSPEDDEAQIIGKFFSLFDKYTPQLVSWNGGGFDLPVLHYRALMHGINAARYWDTGEGRFADSRDFKWNNYISRYHHRHCDLMDVLSLYNGRAAVPLDDIAKLCGFPGKLGMDGSQVRQAHQDGKIHEIRDYCETDAANTYLMYLRFCLISGRLDETAYHAEVQMFKQHIGELAASKAHWAEFAAAWDGQA
ncbi:3'-5' exonuclease [Conchiformibius kuhniae]|uniref:3'-5' exonuclease n=1 Tax=Conchiformibius kuhniae TaxID=211502 RepID=A0A8T9MWU2_9NEIS|nr:3'-5' exonuclease [Conchiformibius kuhniae]UOP04898.1 3'-5' exonuclease [Conchiformibius kuhniae]